MTAAGGEWQLPGLQRFLGEIRQRLTGGGIAVIPRNPGRPDGLAVALRLAGVAIEKVNPKPGQAPAQAIAVPYGATPSLHGLVSTSLWSGWVS